ncbi:hypothetical protein HDU96_007451 [Phlyctochytrium bullatum]|nr:hypothetical protein HDU96_007451 [Phlyctochytrium bullatum]
MADRPTPSLDNMLTEVLHRIIVRHLSPADATHLMAASRALRHKLKPRRLYLARHHLRTYVDRPRSAMLNIGDRGPTKVVEGPPHALGMAEQTKWLLWLCNKLYPSMYSNMGGDPLLEYQSQDMEWIWNPCPLPPMSPRITSALFQLVHAGLSPLPLASAIALVAVYCPDALLALLAFLSALPTPPRDHVPMLLTLLAYLDRSDLITKILTGSLSSLRALQDHLPPDPLFDDFDALRLAARNGHANVVQFSLNERSPFSNLDPDAPINAPLYSASARGHADVIKLLLDHAFVAAPLGVPCVDPSVQNSYCLVSACAKGHASVVKLFLDHAFVAAPLGIPHVEPKDSPFFTLALEVTPT